MGEVLAEDFVWLERAERSLTASFTSFLYGVATTLLMIVDYLSDPGGSSWFTWGLIITIVIGQLTLLVLLPATVRQRFLSLLLGAMDYVSASRPGRAVQRISVLIFLLFATVLVFETLELSRHLSPRMRPLLYGQTAGTRAAAAVVLILVAVIPGTVIYRHRLRAASTAEDAWGRIGLSWLLLSTALLAFLLILFNVQVI